MIFTKIIACLHNMMVAHARSELFQRKRTSRRNRCRSPLETKYAATDAPEDKHAAFLDDALSIRFLLDATYLASIQLKP